MTEVPIYNNEGVQVDSFVIDDNIEYWEGRVWRGDKAWYKGAGVPYGGHHRIDPEDSYDILYTNDVFYLGECVSKRCFEGKTGVFQERYQPHFTDWIGACGEKEIQIIENLWELKFERSAIDVKDWKEIGKSQYYLTCDYPWDRTNYLDASKPDNLFTLIAYMTDNNWNFPWDKDSIFDVHSRGLVTDVADIFVSTDLMHKVGSVYSVLHSLGRNDHKKYQEFCERYMLPWQSDMYFVTNTLSLLARLGVNIDDCMRDNIQDTYKHTVLNYVVPGKNCGFCGVGSCKNRSDTNQAFGEEIREAYIKMAEESLQS